MDTNQLMRLWMHLGRRMGRVQWKHNFGPISKPDFFVLHTLSIHESMHPEQPAMCASDIAGHGHMSRPQVSRQLQQLEDRGWIERRVDPSSKRKILVSLTEEGRSAVRIQHEKIDELTARVFARMGEERALLLMDLIGEMVDTTEEELERMKQEEMKYRGGRT